MKKKWIAVLVMLMLAMAGSVLAACSNEEPAEEPAGRVIHVSVNGNDETGDGSGFDNPYDADYVRNGECSGNVVYNISSEGNELFKVSGIEVYDNVIAGCMNGYGMCFGGYDADLGFTENCSFHNNTFVDTDTTIGVQRSKDNKIYDNICVGDNTGLEFNPDCREEDLVNEFGENIWCFDCEDSFEDRFDAGDYDLGRLIDLDKQQLVPDRDDVLDGFRSLKEGKGSSFVPDEEHTKIYESLED